MDYRKNASSKRVEKENSPPATMGIFLGMWACVAHRELRILSLL